MSDKSSRTKNDSEGSSITSSSLTDNYPAYLVNRTPGKYEAISQADVRTLFSKFLCTIKTLCV